MAIGLVIYAIGIVFKSIFEILWKLCGKCGELCGECLEGERNSYAPVQQTTNSSTVSRR